MCSFVTLHIKHKTSSGFTSFALKSLNFAQTCVFTSSALEALEYSSTYKADEKPRQKNLLLLMQYTTPAPTTHHKITVLYCTVL